MFKKKLILLVTALSLLTGSVTAYADEEVAMMNNISDSILNVQADRWAIFMTDTLNNDLGVVTSKMLADNIRAEGKKREEERKQIVKEAEKIISAHVEQTKQQAEEEARLAYEATLLKLNEVEPCSIPSGMGKLHTYTEWNKFVWVSDCGRVIDALGGQSKSEGGHIKYSSQGFVKYGSWYAAAMTSTFGNVGDMVLIVQDDGTVYPVMIADHKCQSYTSFDSNPANMYGHLNGQCMVEFEVTSWQSIYKGSGSNAGPQFAHYITRVINVGNVYENPEYIENADLVFRSSSVRDLSFIPVPE